MTDKLMTLAHHWAIQTYNKGLGRTCDIDGAKAALAAAIQAEQDYTRAVISERDELKAEVSRLTPLQFRQAPCHMFCESNAYEIELRGLRSERDELKALMHKALDERDHFIRERDKLTMVHAERTVERDKLREVARPVLTALENYTTESGGYCVCCGGESICRKDCEINNAIEALRGALDK